MKSAWCLDPRRPVMRIRFVLPVFALTAVLLSGCVLSKNPLSDPQESAVDEDLFGVWARGTDGQVKEYVLIGRAKGKVPAGMMVARMFAVDNQKSIETRGDSILFFISKVGDQEYWN